VTSTETGTCPVMWPVRQAIHAAGWVHEPCGQPTEPGQRYCADCQGWQAQEHRVSTELTARRDPQHEPELIGEAIYRTARKPWVCECPGNGRRPCPHGDCTGAIAPGRRYVAYLAEPGPCGFSARYCLACGVPTWRADEWRAREQRAPYRSVASTVDPFALVGEPEPALPF
jgi:hypothetical protein